jgi:hypothetical protein
MSVTASVNASFIARAALVALTFGAVPAACGTDVDLGGTSGDAGLSTLDSSGSSDANAPGGQCAPCFVDTDCASGVCAKFADYLFCTMACSTTAPCATDQTCSQLLSPAGATIEACLPNDTKCAPENGPIGPDGAPLEHCNTDLDGPGVTSTCKACGTDTDDCQPNGCYGGYWCDSDKTDCVMPPKTCQ